MGNMAKWVFILLLIIVAAGCDDRATGLKSFNDAPKIVLQAQRGGPETQLLIDSVKISDPAFAYMPLIIRVEDPNKNIKHVIMRVLSGAGYLQYRDDQTTDTVRIIGDRGIYRFVPAHAGSITVRFVVTDYFNVTDSATLQLYVFDNLPPVGSLEVTHLGAADKYEYLFDASGAYDADNSFGGVIKRYVFSVNNIKVAETLTPAIPYIFPAGGIYTCKVQVWDNNGAASKEISLPVQVPN
jgi:hypothetical protein